VVLRLAGEESFGEEYLLGLHLRQFERFAEVVGGGWGMNSSGQMGNGTISNAVLTPVMVSNSQPGGVVNNPVQVPAVILMA